MNAIPYPPSPPVQATERAIAIMAVDNLRPSQECINLMHQIDRGEISHAQAVAAILQKAARYASSSH
jgi:hypothetical protein